MTREETKELVRKIASVFPSWKIESPTQTVNDWYEYLESEDNALIKKALDEYVRSGEVFAPSLGLLVNMATKYKPDPRFEGVDYWERRTKSLYPYEWKSEVYREWYTTDRESQRFFNYLQGGVDAVESGRVKEDQLRDLESVIKVYEAKKCLMMKKG